MPDGSHILVPDIRRAISGKPFRWFPKGETKAVLCDPVPDYAYYHYLNIFSRCESFGLPHGSGWANELPWLLDFLQIMKSYKTEIEAWHHEKAVKRYGRS